MHNVSDRMSVNFLLSGTTEVENLIPEAEKQIPEDNQQHVSNGRLNNQQRIFGDFDVKQNTSFAFNLHIPEPQKTNRNLQSRQVVSNCEQEQRKEMEAAQSILSLKVADSQPLMPCRMGCGNTITKEDQQIVDAYYRDPTNEEKTLKLLDYLCRIGEWAFAENIYQHAKPVGFQAEAWVKVYQNICSLKASVNARYYRTLG